MKQHQRIDATGNRHDQFGIRRDKIMAIAGLNQLLDQRVFNHSELFVYHSVNWLRIVEACGKSATPCQHSFSSDSFKSDLQNICWHLSHRVLQSRLRQFIERDR
jgi:hypothetical protein